MYDQADDIAKIIDEAKEILIVQADNPDADSLGSSLALEEILESKGKKTFMLCGVDIPNYLKYLKGWDRVSDDLPASFDLAIFVDVSTLTLTEKLSGSEQINSIKTKPVIILDHHESVENEIPFAVVKINDAKRSSTGELIYALFKQIGYEIPLSAKEYIMNSILGDTQGLSNSLATAETYRIMAELVASGVDRPKLEESRREYSKMAPEIYAFKADLIKRTQYNPSKEIAYVSINQEEINKFSPLYNPAPLIQGDMLMIENVLVAIVFKSYDDGKLTGAIRCNQSAPIAAKLAESLGGGGHSYASGFKIAKSLDPDQDVEKCLNEAEKLLAEAE
ncbi:MAG TPA: DHH family phosphoesterase [Candidatus Sulfotelmatobacter sp.]|nr:DHH family phosphoesterase [Candidatus Sulfotelmatobacter sp.]